MLTILILEIILIPCLCYLGERIWPQNLKPVWVHSLDTGSDGSLTAEEELRATNMAAEFSYGGRYSVFPK